MMETDWFIFSDDIRVFEAAVNSISASGGGDEPENGLEALAYAIASKWSAKAARKRHVIIVWTDASTHEIGHGKSSQYYPRGMPKDIAELTMWWDNMDGAAKRLIMFAPDKDHWDYISRNWDNVIHYPSAAGKGITDEQFSEVMSCILDL